MAEAFDETLASQTTRPIGALPVVYPILETLGLREIVNGLRYTRADIDLGHIAELLTLNRLLAPQPLCWVKRWASLYWLWPGNKTDNKTAVLHVKALKAFLARHRSRAMWPCPPDGADMTSVPTPTWSSSSAVGRPHGVQS
jgi:hypothetical protein